MDWSLGSVPSFLIYAACSTVVVLIMLSGYFLGEKPSRARAAPFESGIVVTGDARARFFSRFYLFAVFFVIFDLESIYLFAYSYVAAEVGLFGFIQASIFISLFMVALLYLWRMGALSLNRPAEQMEKPVLDSHHG